MALDIKFPFGLADSVALTATGAQAVTIVDNMTIVDGVTVEATGNRTLNLTIDAGVKAGSMISLKTKTNGTETTVFGTGMTGVTLTGEAGKIFDYLFVYDGTTFRQVAAPIKVN